MTPRYLLIVERANAIRILDQNRRPVPQNRSRASLSTKYVSNCEKVQDGAENVSCSNLPVLFENVNSEPLDISCARIKGVTLSK